MNVPLQLPDLLVIVLAAWRLAYLAVREDAPFRLMARFRARTTLGGMLTCIYCSSVWTAALTLLLWHWGMHIVVLIFAISGGALMLAAFTGVNRPN